MSQTQKEKLSAVRLAKKRKKLKAKTKTRKKANGMHGLGVKDIGEKKPWTRMQTPGTDWIGY